MHLLLILMDLSFITIILICSTYFDFKNRKIPNKFIIVSFIFGLVLNLYEIRFFYRTLLDPLILKILVFFIVFLICLLLFSLKIIGGSDGKIILLVFLVHPVKYLKYHYVLIFFLIYSLFIITSFFFILIINNINKNSYSFQIYFNLHFEKLIRRVFTKMFYKFYALGQMEESRGDKFFIDNLFIFYNNQKRELQFLAQFRPPLMIICLIAYYLLLFLIIGI